MTGRASLFLVGAVATLSVGAAAVGLAQSPSHPHEAISPSPISSVSHATAPTVPPTPATGRPFEPSFMGLSWVTTEDAFALARQACGKESCAVVARTTDGGRTWAQLPATPAEVPPASGCTAFLCANGVTGVTFASSTVGYLYGPSLFVTTDGGQTWEPVAGPRVASLTVGDGRVFRIVFRHGGCPGPCTTSLQVAPAGTTAWRTVLADLPGDAADRLQVLVAGSDVYVAGYGDVAQGAGTQRAVLYRSIDGGVTFEKLTDPCVGRLPALHLLTALAAARDGVLQGICSRRAGGGRRYLATSTDAGATWLPLRPLPRGSYGVVAAASASTIAAATGAVTGKGTKTATLLVTTDGGRTWRTVATDALRLGTVAVAQAGFVTAQVGWWLASPHGAFSTTDGGEHWAPMPLVPVPTLQAHAPEVAS